VHTYVEEDETELNIRPLFTTKVTLKVWLHDKVVGRTKHGETHTHTQDWFRLLCVVLKSDKFISSANKVVILCSVDLLRYVC